MLVAGAQPSADVPANGQVAALVAAGEESYAWNCAVCHGAGGGGIEEARLRFPPDERRCTRCHRPANRAVQPLDRPVVDNDMFSIGEPPALHPTEERPAPLAAVAAPEALHAYLAATMPRYDPGRLSDEEYWALTAFLLDMNGRAAELPRVVELAARE
ncbi:MAG TPA: c-type cytochrome [Trueperaceae bacterium]|nr:c-type cytochrome [Trueperaceae bacterium]